MGFIEWVQHADVSAATALHAFALDHPLYVRVLRFLTDVAWDPMTLRLAVAAAVVVLLRRRAVRQAAWAAVAMTTAALTSTLLKLAVARSRPQLPDPVDHAAGYAFPSGHALTGMVGCGVLLVLLRPALRGAWRAVAWSVAAVTVTGVGFTRIALGVHWVSDVVAGWLLGLAVLATTAAAFRAISIRSRSRRTRGH